MPSLKALAAKYSAILLQASRIDESSATTKTASTYESMRQKLAIRKVVSAIDELTWDSTGLSLSLAEKWELYDLIAADLGVPDDEWGMIKEGSVEKALSFEDTLSQLLQKVEYE